MIRFITIVSVLFLLFLQAPRAWSNDLMLPEVWQDQDVTGWWMSEKLDGVRAYWDGHQLVSKGGQVFHPPQEFIDALPPFALEGELWGGRNTFSETVSAVRQKQPHSGWLELKFGIFDVPEKSGAFSSRIRQAENWFSAHPFAYAFVIHQVPVKDQAHLREELARVEALGGEGLIVRDPEAGYRVGRSHQILKVKTCHDAEATVIKALPGKGKLDGKMGALLVVMNDGTKLRLGSGFSIPERENPPVPGTVVTFKHYGFYASGIPKFPSFLRVRDDAGL